MNDINQYRWCIFIGCSLMIFLVNVDVTIVNLALATIAKNLHTTLSQTQWIINSYLLTTIVFFIIGGKLSDIFGHKRIFLFGTLFFALASLLAGISTGFTLLIIARLLQGIGFAFTLGLALLMSANAFPVTQRGFVLGLSVTITGLGLAVGPTLGGLMLETLDWHWIFLINVPIAILSFGLILIFYKTQESTIKTKTMDYSGAILFGLATILLLLTFDVLAHHPINLKLFLIGIGLSWLVFIVFFWKEINTKFPLIDFKLFSNRDYTLSIVIRFLFMYIYGTFLFFIPLYLQNILAHTALVSGLMLLIYSAVFAISSPFSGIWCDRVGYKLPLIFSAFTCLLAFMLLTFINLQMPSSLILILMGFVCFGISGGVMLPSTVNSTISSLPKVHAGEGIGTFFTVAFIGASLGVAISGAQVNFISAHHLINSQPHLFTSLNNNNLEALYNIANGTQPVEKLKLLFDTQSYQTLSQLTKESFMQGFSSVMWVNVFFSFMILLLSFCLKKSSKRSVN